MEVLQGGLICPGFVDLQANGGGGVMLNDAPATETIATICKAHLPFGTTSLLPTLITDTPARMAEIRALAAAGAIVSLGHSDADYPAAMEAIRAGAACATHLFNAMSQLTARAPGLAGAALESGALHAGLIADGIHVDPATIRIALRAKAGPGRIFLVSAPDTGRRHARGRRSRHDLGGALHGGNRRDRAGRGAAHGLSLPGRTDRAQRRDRPSRPRHAGRFDFLHLDDDLNILGVWQGGIRRLP